MKRRYDDPPSWNEISVIFCMFRGGGERLERLFLHPMQNGDTTIKEEEIEEEKVQRLAAAVYVWGREGKRGKEFYPQLPAQALPILLLSCRSLLSFISSANQTDCTQLSRSRNFGADGDRRHLSMVVHVIPRNDGDTSIAGLAFSPSTSVSGVFGLCSPSWLWTRRTAVSCEVHIYLRLPLFNMCCLRVYVRVRRERRKWLYLFGDGGACAQFQGYPTPGAMETCCHGNETSRYQTSPSVHLLHH